MMRWIFAGLAAMFLAGPAAGEETTADLLRTHLYAGDIAQGLEEMQARGADDDEAVFGVGVFSFFAAVEDMAQALYRHGFNPERGIAVGPFMGMAQDEGGVPREAPEPLTYEDLRSYLQEFASALDAARPLLLAASEGDFAVEIDVLEIRVDIDGDGVAGEMESIGAFLALAAQTGERVDMGMGMAPDLDMPHSVFAFDAADAIWLAGYSQVLAVQLDFLLAHDFETFFDASMHRLFPGSGLKMESVASTGSIFLERESDALLADAIAMVHTVNWPVTDSDRLAGVRERALDVLNLSRQNWAAILAETDDNLEFIPSPTQTSQFQTLEVTKATVEAWLETLDVVGAILEGDLLLPHWRFGELGFDLADWFENAERTDFVLLFTGLDALPYMREGDVVDAETFAAANAVFGGSIWNYAVWFN